MVAGRSNLTDVWVDIIHSTDKAILVSNGDDEVWLPKSLIEYDGEPGDHIEVTLPETLAIKEGLV